MKLCRVNLRDRQRYRILLRSIQASKTYVEILSCEQALMDPWGSQIHPCAYGRLKEHLELRKSLIRKRGMAKCVSRKNG